MSVRPVRIYGDPVLREKARDVRDFDDSAALSWSPTCSRP